MRTYSFVRSVKLCMLWCYRNVVLWSLWSWCKCELVHVSSFAILWIFWNSELREFVRLVFSIMLCNCENWDLWILWIIQNCSCVILWIGWFCVLVNLFFLCILYNVWFGEYCEFVTILNIVKSGICEFRELVIFVML